MKHSFKNVVQALSVSVILLPAVVSAETPDSCLITWTWEQETLTSPGRLLQVLVTPLAGAT